MLDFIKRTPPWDQAYSVLAAGEPMMIERLLALNAVFLILYIIRRAKGFGPLRQPSLLYVQVCLLAANFLVLFESDVQQFLNQFI